MDMAARELFAGPLDMPVSLGAGFLFYMVPFILMCAYAAQPPRVEF